MKAIAIEQMAARVRHGPAARGRGGHRPGLAVGEVRRLALVIALALLAAPGIRAAASILPGAVPDGRAAPSRRPPLAHVANLPWGGGSVLHWNRTHLIFWAPAGSGLGFDPGYTSLFSTFMADVAHDSHLPSNVYGLTGQYTDNGGAGGLRLDLRRAVARHRSAARARSRLPGAVAAAAGRRAAGMEPVRHRQPDPGRAVGRGRRAPPAGHARRHLLPAHPERPRRLRHRLDSRQLRARRRATTTATAPTTASSAAPACSTR